MGWPKKRPDPPIGPDEDVFAVDVTQRWYDDQHGFRVFTDPDWFAWAAADDGSAPPASLKVSNPHTPLPASPTHNERVLYLIRGPFRHGAYAGARRPSCRRGQNGRRSLRILTAEQDREPGLC